MIRAHLKEVGMSKDDSSGLGVWRDGEGGEGGQGGGGQGQGGHAAELLRGEDREGGAVSLKMWEN